MSPDAYRDALIAQDALHTCPSCGGHGANTASDNLNWLPCDTCRGSGKVKQAMLDHLSRIAGYPVRAGSPSETPRE